MNKLRLGKITKQESNETNKNTQESVVRGILALHAYFMISWDIKKKKKRKMWVCTQKEIPCCCHYKKHLYHLQQVYHNHQDD